MGGTTITIQENNLLKAIEELNKQRENIEENIHLFLDGITIMEKDENGDGEYNAIGDQGLEFIVGMNYQKEKPNKKIVIFAHFGK